MALGQERAILMKKKRRKKKVLTVSDFKIDNLYIYKKSYSRYKPIKKSDLVLYTNWINKYSGFWKLIGE